MNEPKAKAVVLTIPAATGNEQPLSNNDNLNITENQPECNNNFDVLQQMQKQLQRVNSPDYLRTVSISELFDTVYKPRLQVIEGLLFSGVYIFAGAPKVGKSFFMAQLGYHISNGINLWNYSVLKGTVLYLALEDDYSRLQKRLSRMFGTESTEDFHFATHAKNLSDGLNAQLKRFIQENNNTKLIIIDTLQKIREIGGEKYSYASDYDIVTQLKKFADNHNICILIVHHTRKQGADDSFDTISGTNGLLGAADGGFVMQKEKRTDNKATLEIIGRDQLDQRLHLLFDREHCIWQLTETETELWKEPPDPILESVSKIVTPEFPIWSGSASELITNLDGLDIQPNVLTRRLNVGAATLLSEYGVSYECSRGHAGRIVKLTLDNSVA
jgi:RecA-family ATPase